MDGLERVERVDRRRIVRGLFAIAAVAQLVVAMVLVVRAIDDDTARIRLVTPAGVAQDDPTTSDVPVALSGDATTTSTAPAALAPPETDVPEEPVAAAPQPGVISGVIGAGIGGTTSADLTDAAGHTWHRDGDPYGRYEFIDLEPGRYELVLTAETAPAPCAPEGPCIGSAVASSRDVIDLRAGEHREKDFPMYGPTVPAPSTTTTSTTAA
jgi:hypothetical protein